MADSNVELTPTERIQAIIDELGVDWEAAALLVTIENGDAFIDDVVFEWSTDREPMATADGRSSRTGPEELVGAASHAESGAARSDAAPGQAPGRSSTVRKSSSAA